MGGDLKCLRILSVLSMGDYKTEERVEQLMINTLTEGRVGDHSYLARQITMQRQKKRNSRAHFITYASYIA